MQPQHFLFLSRTGHVALSHFPRRAGAGPPRRGYWENSGWTRPTGSPSSSKVVQADESRSWASPSTDGAKVRVARTGEGKASRGDVLNNAAACRLRAILLKAWRCTTRAEGARPTRVVGVAHGVDRGEADDVAIRRRRQAVAGADRPRGPRNSGCRDRIYRWIERGYAGRASMHRSRAAEEGEARARSARGGQRWPVVGLKGGEVQTSSRCSCPAGLHRRRRLDLRRQRRLPRMFGLVNGDCAPSSSALPGAAKRCSCTTATPRQSQQKRMMRIRRAAQDPAAQAGFPVPTESHLNSSSLGGMCAIDMLLAAYGDGVSTRSGRVRLLMAGRHERAKDPRPTDTRRQTRAGRRTMPRTRQADGPDLGKRGRALAPTAKTTNLNTVRLRAPLS